MNKPVSVCLWKRHFDNFMRPWCFWSANQTPESKGQGAVACSQWRSLWQESVSKGAWPATRRRQTNFLSLVKKKNLQSFHVSLSFWSMFHGQQDVRRTPSPPTVYLLYVSSSVRFLFSFISAFWVLLVFFVLIFVSTGLTSAGHAPLKWEPALALKTDL